MTKHLADLLEIPASFDCEVKGLNLDSRTIGKGEVFIALYGYSGRQHGHDFIEQALNNGASAVLLDTSDALAQPYWQQQRPCIPVQDLLMKLSEIAANFYDDPSANLQIVGVTGTNGKSSITHFIAQLLPPPCGLIGTLGYGIYGELRAGNHTTPQATTVQQLLADFHQRQVPWVAMEVSSHGLHQGRVDSVHIDTAVFTNLTRDHLDYHGDMQTYAETKRRLFHWPGLKTAVINLDDSFGKQLAAELVPSVRLLSYSLTDHSASVFVQHYEVQDDGVMAQVSTPWGMLHLQIPLLGAFNLSNVLAAVSVALNWGVTLEQVQAAARTLCPVTGRMEVLQHPGYARAIIDYAHTPDALEQTLKALKAHCRGRLICVFGCGGDRDQGKRPLMGAIAAQWADQMIITTDNPRHEAADAILADIIAGVPEGTDWQRQPDRTLAIQTALTQAQADDFVLIAGKGHECYQEIAGTRLHFSDHEVVNQVFAQAHLILS